MENQIDNQEKIIIEIPQESEEFLKEKQNFQWDLNTEMFAKFWGLYIMKIPIPDNIWDYVWLHRDLITDPKLYQAIEILAGAPIEKDDYVRQMVLGMVM